jgi:hypothetical protein
MATLRRPLRLVLPLGAISLALSCGSGARHVGDPAGASARPGSGASPVAAQATPPPPLAELPRGGRTLLPTYRLVAYYGAAGGPGLGVLGRGSPDQAAAAIEKQAAAYARFGRRVQPVMELITTTAQPAPGPDGTYSRQSDPSVVRSYLAAARRHRMLLILDFQPGRGTFLPQVKRYAEFINEPDVGVALDPEWRMGPGQVPARVIGSARAAEINGVSAYLSALTTQRQLPQKAFVVHQFTREMLPDRAKIIARPGLATIFHADGFGTQALKRGVYQHLALPGPPFRIGFKLFYKADTQMMTPAQAMALRPQPDLITYQ